MPRPIALASFTLAALVIWISYIDLLTFSIPDIASLAVLILGAVTIFNLDQGLVLSHISAGVVAFVSFAVVGEILFRFNGIEMLGFGDAKLFGASAVWIGPIGIPSLLLVAAVSGIAYSVAARRHRKRVPFGPFLGFGTLIVWLYGPIGI